MNIKKIDNINSLISRRKTGSPKVLANSVGISERMLYHFLKFMKEELSAPIKYDKGGQTYLYDDTGELNLKWKSHSS